MKTTSIREALAQYLRCGIGAPARVRRALEEVEAIEDALGGAGVIPPPCLHSEYDNGTCILPVEHEGQHQFWKARGRRPDSPVFQEALRQQEQRSEEAQAKPKPCPVLGCPMHADTHVHGVVAGGTQQQGGVIGVGRQKPPLGPSPFCAVPACDNPPVKPGVVCCVHLEHT